MTVPKYFYKVVYDLMPPQKMIAFIQPNEGSAKPLITFATTVDVVEAVTDLDFFSPVPKAEQERLESTILIEAWSRKE